MWTTQAFSTQRYFEWIGKRESIGGSKELFVKQKQFIHVKETMD